MRLETLVWFVIPTIGFGYNPSLEERLEYLKKVDMAVYENIVNDSYPTSNPLSEDQMRPLISGLHQRLRTMEDVVTVAEAISSELSPIRSLSFIENAINIAVKMEYARLLNMKIKYTQNIRSLDKEIELANSKLTHFEQKFQYFDRNMNMFSKMIEVYYSANAKKYAGRSTVSTIFKQEGLAVSGILKNFGLIADEQKVESLFFNLRRYLSGLRKKGFQDSDIYSLLINTKEYFKRRYAEDREPLIGSDGVHPKRIRSLQKEKDALAERMQEADNAAVELLKKFSRYWPKESQTHEEEPIGIRG